MGKRGKFHSDLHAQMPSSASQEHWTKTMVFSPQPWGKLASCEALHRLSCMDPCCSTFFETSLETSCSLVLGLFLSFPFLRLHPTSLPLKFSVGHLSMASLTWAPLWTYSMGTIWKLVRKVNLPNLATLTLHLNKIPHEGKVFQAVCSTVLCIHYMKESGHESQEESHLCWDSWYFSKGPMVYYMHTP